jgi:hypothetical protein
MNPFLKARDLVLAAGKACVRFKRSPHEPEVVCRLLFLPEVIKIWNFVCLAISTTRNIQVQQMVIQNATIQAFKIQLSRHRSETFGNRSGGFGNRSGSFGNRSGSFRNRLGDLRNRLGSFRNRSGSFVLVHVGAADALVDHIRFPCVSLLHDLEERWSISADR